MMNGGLVLAWEANPGKGRHRRHFSRLEVRLEVLLILSLTSRMKNL
jgi:hypothetical protein